MEMNDFKRFSEQELSEVSGGGRFEDCVEAVEECLADVGDAVREFWGWLAKRVESFKDGRTGIIVGF
jgi:hypothetical protein